MNSYDPVTLLVVGPTARLHDLAAFVPESWLVLRRERLDDHPEHADIVLMIEPATSTITRACRSDPDAAVIAVLSPSCDHEDVVRALDAGADACVRTHNAAIIGAHAEACHRRLLASPWYAQVA
jgi:DNA-binding NarL/FixJ family response regulator